MYPRTETKEIRIGKYIVREWTDENSVWIGIASGNCAGEGGQFSTEDVEKAIADFYDKYF